MANQANTSMADRQEQKIKDCHSNMVIRLGKHFNPKLQDNWEELLLWLSKFLDPVDLQRKDNSFIQICYKLMAQGIIDYGSYDELYEVIKKIDAGPAKIIQETSEEIKDIKSKGTPTVVILEANYTALIGERVELKCSVAAIPWITSVSWQHILPGGQSVQLSIDQRKYKGSKPYDPHLVINELMKDDEGEYVCTVSNVCGKGQSAPTKLTIKGGPPTVTMNTTRYWKTEGEIAVFRCTVIAKPPAFAITWSKEEEGQKRIITVDLHKYIGGSLMSPSLVIDDLEKPLDEGKYVCEAENIAGIGSNSVYLTINSKTANTETISRDPDKPRGTFAENSKSIIEYARELVRPYGNLTGFNVECGLDIRKVNVRFTVQEDIIHLKESFHRQLGQMLGEDYRIVNVQMFKGCTIVSFDITGATHPLDESALALAERFTTGLTDGSILLTDETGNTLQIQLKSIKITMKETLDDAADIDVPRVSIDQAAYSVVTGDKANLKSRLLTSTPITSVTWFRIDNENGTEHAIVIDKKKYFGGSVESPSLVIDNTTVEDTGRYVCHAENRCGVGKSVSTALCIYNSEGNDLPVEILQMDQQSIQLYRKCLEEKEEEDYRLRVIVIGQTEVGKTTLTRNLLRLPQIIPHTKSTDGVDIHNSFVNLDDKDWITDADMQHGGKCMDARLIQSLQSIASENTGADPNTEGDKSAQTASNSDDVSFSSGEFDNDDQHNAGHARQIQSPEKKAGADPDDLKKLGPSTPANANESDLKTLRNLMIGPLADRDYTRLGELSVWDFAGQFVFYTTHHTFLTHRAVYLLVTRLDQNINDTVGNDQCFLDATGCKEMKIKDFVSYWMNSVHLYSGAAEHLPPVILVGTHLDKVEGDIEKKTETYFDDLRRYLLDMESPTSRHLIDTDYTVSNPPNKLEIGNLRKKIVELASKQAYWGEKIPAKWITLEKALMEKKIEGVNIMSYEKVVELDKSTGVPIDDQKKIDLFLRFQHAKGNMIYFSEDCLRDYIVLNPQWLIDAFKCIITAQQICTKNPALVKHWKALDKTGKLYLGMVDEIFRREDKFCRHKEHILGLMERLHIISHHVVDKDDDKSNTSEEFYFVPSLLKDKVTECEIENYVKGTNGTPYLCYVFENNFLPTAVFHRLIAACLSEYTVAKQGSKFLIFCGCGIFDLNGGLTRLVVAFYDNIIQIGLFRFSKERCAPETSTCVSVRQFVTKTLERVLDRYDMKLPFTLNLKCEKSPLLSHEGLLSEDAVIKGGEEMVCHGHDKESHIINRDILLHLWFPAQVAATNTNQGGAKHYNKASNEDIPEEAIVIHNEMVNHLDGYIYGDDLIKLKELFKEIPLTPAVMGKIHKIHDLFTHLIDSEIIRIGCYKKLTPNLRQINRKLATLVENKEKDIRDIIN